MVRTYLYITNYEWIRHSVHNYCLYLLVWLYTWSLVVVQKKIVINSVHVCGSHESSPATQLYKNKIENCVEIIIIDNRVISLFYHWHFILTNTLTLKINKLMICNPLWEACRNKSVIYQADVKDWSSAILFFLWSELWMCGLMELRWLEYELTAQWISGILVIVSSTYRHHIAGGVGAVSNALLSKCSHTKIGDLGWNWGIHCSPLFLLIEFILECDCNWKAHFK